MRPQLNTIGTPSLLEVWWHCVHFTGQFVLIQKDPRNVYVCVNVLKEKESRRGSQPFISGHPIHHSYLHDSSCMAATVTKQFAPLISTYSITNYDQTITKSNRYYPKSATSESWCKLSTKKHKRLGMTCGYHHFRNSLRGAMLSSVYFLIQPAYIPLLWHALALRTTSATPAAVFFWRGDKKIGCIDLSW